MAKLRGTVSSKLYAIAETLKLTLKAAKDEKELRKLVEGVIKTCQKWEYENPSTFKKRR